MIKLKRILRIAAWLMLCAAPRVSAWGALGHQAVAAVAHDMLSDQARAALARLAPADTNLASIAVWADDIKGARPETRGWHFVDVEVDARYDSAAAVKPNVATALDHDIAVLTEGTAGVPADSAAREEALKWVVHLVGDLHQPLHVGEEHDRGGNLQKVRLDGRAYNLHEVWDFVLLERLGLTLDGLKVLLESDIQKDSNFIRRNARGTVAGWIEEAHRESARCYVVDGKPLVNGAETDLDSEYAARSTAIAIRQLQRAAVRLAWVLNRALAPGDPAGRAAPVLHPSAGPILPASAAVSMRAGASSGHPAARPKNSAAAAGNGSARYAWSVHSDAYHYPDCIDVARIKPENLRTGDEPPPGRHLHAGCPRH